MEDIHLPAHGYGSMIVRNRKGNRFLGIAGEEVALPSFSFEDAHKYHWYVHAWRLYTRGGGIKLCVRPV